MWSDYNPLDQLVATYQGSAGHNEDAPRPSGLTKLRENSWDQLGRQTAETVVGSAAESRSYTWSGDDRLLSVKLGSASDAPVIKYSYDSSGTRVARSALPSSPGDDPEETRYLADYENLTGYSQVLAEVGASEEDSRSYVYGQEHLPLAQLGGGSGPAFFHGDHLGTTRQLTGPAGDGLLASPANYSPFGDPETAALSSLTSMAYTGQHRDSSTDLQYHRARWLSTEQGRWLSEDPVWDFMVFGNAYNTSIRGIDPLGTFTMLEVGMVNGIISDIVSMQFQALADSLGDSQEFKETDAAKFAAVGAMVFAIIALASLVISLGPAVIRFISKLPQLISKLPHLARGLISTIRNTANYIRSIKKVGNPSIGSYWDAISTVGKRNTSLPRFAQGHYECTPTSGVMALESMGKSVNKVNFVANFTGLIKKQNGMYFSQLIGKLKAAGASKARELNGRHSATIEKLREATKGNTSAIVSVKNFNPDPTGPSRHAIVVDGFTRRQGVDVVAIRDPYKGTQYFESLESFKNRYAYNCIVFN